ncbi:hypothetical protein ACTGW9_08875, partial [Streptococcus suis]
VKMRAGKPFYFVQIVKILAKRRGFRLKKEKDKRLISVCLHSETVDPSFFLISVIFMIINLSIISRQAVIKRILE